MHTRISLPKSFLFALLTMLVALGCGRCGARSIEEGEPDKVKGVVTGSKSDDVEPHTLKGVVTDAAGKPLAGVEVFADDLMAYNANMLGTTDAKGEYRIELPPNRVTTYRAGASVKLDWDNQHWMLSLHPDSNNGFAGSEGAVRNFTWKVSGPDHQGGRYGSEIWVYRDLEDGDLNLDEVEVTFAPAGPRIDGSRGEGFTMRLENGSNREDVAIGRYTVTARNVVQGVPLEVRQRGIGDYAPSVEASFASKKSYGSMELEVSAR